jgi:hypothetical protein
MVQQLFDSPQDMTPHSLIGASANYEYSLFYLSHDASMQAVACPSPMLNTSKLVPFYLRSIKVIFKSHAFLNQQ